MTLIIESGGTKADVALIDKEQTVHYDQMNGFNPTVSHVDDLKHSIANCSVIQDNINGIKKIVFYGAGLSKPANIQLVYQLLVERFPLTEVQLHEDMVAAIRASSVLQTGNRIVCILGTGCNLAKVKNEEVINSGVSLGYILGDEGSGAYLGKKFLAKVLRGELDDSIWHEVSQHFGISDKNDAVTTLYKHPKPNQWLASLCPIIKNHIDETRFNSVVTNCFHDFVKAKLDVFKNSKDLPVFFVGSIAIHFEEQLKVVLTNHGYHFAGTIESPIKILVEYEIAS